MHKPRNDVQRICEPEEKVAVVVVEEEGEVGISRKDSEGCGVAGHGRLEARTESAGARVGEKVRGVVALCQPGRVPV